LFPDDLSTLGRVYGERCARLQVPTWSSTKRSYNFRQTSLSWCFGYCCHEAPTWRGDCLCGWTLVHYFDDSRLTRCRAMTRRCGLAPLVHAASYAGYEVNTPHACAGATPIFKEKSSGIGDELRLPRCIYAFCNCRPTALLCTKTAMASACTATIQFPSPWQIKSISKRHLVEIGVL